MKRNTAGKTKSRGTGVVLGRTLAFLAVTVVLILAILMGVIWVLEKGPSPTVTAIFCRSVRETSAIQWVANIYLSDEEIDQYKSQSTETMETQAVNTSLRFQITVSILTLYFKCDGLNTGFISIQKVQHFILELMSVSPSCIHAV